MRTASLLVLMLLLVGCRSSARNEKPAARISEQALTKLRAHTSFVIVENRELPPGTPDTGLTAQARAALVSAGLREDPNSPLRIEFQWRGQAVPYDYRTYVGNQTLSARYTGAITGGRMRWLDQGSEILSRDFAVSIRPQIDFPFRDKNHMSTPAEAPFREAVFAYETPGNGPFAAFIRVAALAWGEPIVRWTIARPELSMQYLGAELAGELRLASLRPVLEQKALGRIQLFPDPAVASAKALGRLPPDARTTALLKQLARSDSMAWVAAFSSLVELREERDLPELFQILEAARVPLAEEGRRLLDFAREKCTPACESSLIAYRAKVLHEIADLESRGQTPFNVPLLKTHVPLIDEILARITKNP